MSGKVSVPVSTEFHRLMAFDGLDNCRFAERVLVLAWRIEDDGLDRWTQRLLAFKAGDPQAIRGACAVLTEALAACSLSWRSVVVVPALPSEATSLDSQEPLAHLGQAL